MVPAADFLVAHGPSDGAERWEEQSGYSPSTIAAEIAGLTAAAHIAAVNGDRVRARLYQAIADDSPATSRRWTVTDNGPFISSDRAELLHPRSTKNGDPDSADRRQPRQRQPHRRRPALGDRRRLPRAGAARRPAAERPDGQVVADRRRRHPRALDAQRRRLLPLRHQRHRVRSTATATAYQPSGSSCTTPRRPVAADRHRHRAPVAGAQRRARRVRARRRRPVVGPHACCSRCRTCSRARAWSPSRPGRIPDLAASPYGTDPATASIGFTDGEAAGSASPLTWAQAQYARLAIDLSAGRDLETPQIVTDRYVTHGMPGLAAGHDHLARRRERA